MAVFSGPEIVNDGLVLHLDAANPLSYPGSGTTWFDLSGNGNNGTLINGAYFNSENKGSMGFDGSNDYVRFNSGLYGRTSFSFSYWFLQNSLKSSSQEMFTSDYTTPGNTSNPGIEIYSRNTTLYFRSNYNDFNKPATATITANAWTYIVCVCEVDSIIRIYANGVEGNSNIPTNPYIIWNNESLNLGVLTNYNNFLPFSGNISGAMVYSRAISEKEVKQNFEATRDRYGI